jgi:hypothetical protein
MDVIAKKKNPKKALKDSAKHLAKSSLSDIYKEAGTALLNQSGKGATTRGHTIRKRKHSPTLTSCKKRKTIFD